MWNLLLLGVDYFSLCFGSARDTYYVWYNWVILGRIGSFWCVYVLVMAELIALWFCSISPV